MFQHKGIFNGLFGRYGQVGLGSLLAVGLGLAGCSDQTTSNTVVNPPADAPLVVVTTSVLCDLTQQVAEATVALTCLLPLGQDPHTYQAKPSDRQAIELADLVLYDGYGAAPSLIALVQGSGTAAPKVAVYEAAVPNPLMGVVHDHDHDEPGEDIHSEEDAAAADHEDEHNHAHDDDNAAADGSRVDPVPDPHIWHSAKNNGAIATVIATQLAAINPAEAERYEQNATQLTEQFTQLDGWIAAQIATIPPEQRHLVTTHDSFRYFADAYGLAVKGALSGLSTEAKPTPSALTALVDQVKAAGVPAIFAETTTNPDLIATVAKNAGVIVAAQPLFVEGPGGPGSMAETTQAMLVANTCTVVEALGGTCNGDEAPISR